MFGWKAHVFIQEIGDGHFMIGVLNCYCFEWEEFIDSSYLERDSVLVLTLTGRFNVP